MNGRSPSTVCLQAGIPRARTQFLGVVLLIWNLVALTTLAVAVGYVYAGLPRRIDLSNAPWRGGSFDVMVHCALLAWVCHV